MGEVSVPADGREPLSWYIGWAAAGSFFVLGLWHASLRGLGRDSRAYWAAIQDIDHLYELSALTPGAYLYSPVFAHALYPLKWLPWIVFGILWSAACAAVFAWLLWPLRGRWFLPAMLAVTSEIISGNIYAFMAAAIVLATRGGAWRGCWWLLLGFTKITPALLGVTWMTVRREWAVLARVALVGLGLAGASAILDSDSWIEWVRFLFGAANPDSDRAVTGLWGTAALWLAGAGCVLTAARAGRLWLLAPAAILFSPTLGVSTLTILAAIPRLRAGAAATDMTKAAPARPESSGGTALAEGAATGGEAQRES